MLLVDLVFVLTVALTITATTYQVIQVLEEQLEEQSQATAHLLSRSIASAQHLLREVETALGNQMVVQARIAAHLVAVAERGGMAPGEINVILGDIADHTVLEEFWITGESARAYLTNTGVDFIFSPSPIDQPQASQFYRLLNENNGVVIQEAMPRELDGQMFKYVGVSGVDKPRIVQVGYPAGLLEELGQTYSLQGLLDDAVGRSGVQYVHLVDAESNTVAVSREENLPAIDSADSEEAKEARDNDAADAAKAMEQAEPVLRWEPDALVVTAPVLSQSDGEQTVWGAVTMYVSTDDLRLVRQGAIVGGLVLGVVLCIIGGVASYWMAGRIAAPLQRMVRLTQEVADGDLSHEIEVRQPAELGQLEAALAQMTDSLRDTILRIRDSSQHVRHVATEIEAVVTELNKTASQQSAAVAETTAAMEELRAVAGQIADGSEVVSGAATQTQSDVQAGFQAVSETVVRMEEIRAENETSVNEILALGYKARQIGAVMDLIDDIAAQTKLIAINASIEAAAAGEAGQRFGVVAGQVRSLADNVAQSTDEIQQHIREIQTATNELTIAAEQGQKKIDQGVALSQTTENALGKIATSADQTSLSANQITISTRQQQTAVEQVVEALHDLTADVNRVASSSNQTTQIVADLMRLSKTLNELVALFDLGES
jgi:methyl-accepting chemotaxis protein